MIKRFVSIVIMVSLLVTFAVGCAEKESPPATDYDSLVDNLRDAGATVEPTFNFNPPFFSVEGKTITVNGENVQVFEYADEAAAGAEADTISPNGGTIGNTALSWMVTPHFFQSGRIIVIYVGDNQEIIELLTEALGAQIAGG